MRVDGREIASNILKNLQQQVEQLKQKNIIPHLVIFLVGSDLASTVYVRQKEKQGASIGAKVTVYRLTPYVTTEEIVNRIKELNSSKEVHGIIVQRPLPKQIDDEQINQAVDPEKDVDSFRTDSLYKMPLAAAVLHILEHIFNSSKKDDQDFNNWLREKNIVVAGKGATGGGPIITLLKKSDINPSVIDSKTENTKELLGNADIVISAVGKPNIFDAKLLKKDVIVIAVGMGRGGDNKLHPDFDEATVAKIASFYTPVPGGVGPVNVAMLLKNVVDSAKS